MISDDCTASWLKAKARAGEFPALKIGGAWNFTDAHIAEILRLCEVPARKAAQPAQPAATAKQKNPKRTTPDNAPFSLPATGVVQLRARQPRKRSVG